MRFECASRTHVGLKRKINEDSVLAEPDRGLVGRRRRDGRA